METEFHVGKERDEVSAALWDVGQEEANSMAPWVVAAATTTTAKHRKWHTINNIVNTNAEFV